MDEDDVSGELLVKRLMARLGADARKAVVTCHTMHREIDKLETPLAILGWITIWIRDWGLLEEDAAEILREMTNPETTQSHKFASDLKSSLAAAAFRKIEHRRREARLKTKALEPVIPVTESTAVKSILDEAIEKFGVPKDKPAEEPA